MPRRLLRFIADSYWPFLSGILYNAVGPMGISNFMRSNKCTRNVITPQNAPAKYPAPDEQIGQRLVISNDSQLSGKRLTRKESKVRNMANTTLLTDNDDEEKFNCTIDVYAKTAHHPVYYISSHALFHSDKALVGPDDVIFPGSFTVELYSSFTSSIPSEDGSVMDFIAQKTCPRTHSKCPSLLRK
ncbi:uncharacterized protein LOC108681094 [Hyalella azteca]|uniref:Uncharacterized protein LOC108681094 n=1 Tax=Hyalella azteca TaxID=294128 RepID=A0A8B7PHD7_HYAAZ|nr:uncharacterized protein LOC108681094 [Hyalella azteca]